MRTLGNLAVMSGTHGGTHTGRETRFVASFPTHVEEIAELGADCVNRRRTICGERGARRYGGTTAAEERAGQPCRAGLPRILGLPGDRRSQGVPALRALHQRGRLPGPPADAALRGHHRAAGRAAPGRACLDTCGTAAHLTSPNAPSARPAPGQGPKGGGRRPTSGSRRRGLPRQSCVPPCVPDITARFAPECVEEVFSEEVFSEVH